MSGIFFDLPSVRFLLRFRFFGTMMRIFASLLRRWLSAPACGSRKVYFRLAEAECSAASQRACNLFDWTIGDSLAADGVPNVSGALRPFNNWVKREDYYELLFIRKTLTPLARWGPTQRKSRTISRPAGSSEDAEKDILATGSRVFRKRQGQKENRSATTQRHAAFAAGAET